MKPTINDVINKGFCIGCGVCAAADPKAYNVKMNGKGMYEATFTNERSSGVEVSKICPFSSIETEDTLASEIFGKESLHFHKYIGQYHSAWFSHLTCSEYRLACTSGGLASWFLEFLLKNKKIDGVIHVGSSNSDVQLFDYRISHSVEEIRECRKSRYYPVQMGDVLQRISGDDKRYAVVGVPCFIKALRLLKKYDPRFGNISYFFGIICGQLKSKNFASMFAMQNGIKPESLQDVDFRWKREGEPAGDYGMKFTYQDPESDEIKTKISKPARHHFGSDWGYGFFKYPACDACDDVFAETADIVFGDAWVEPYKKSWKGENLLIIRNPEFQSILSDLLEAGEVEIAEASIDSVVSTQAPSIRHRIDHIGFRNRIQNAQLGFAPFKRLRETNAVSLKSRMLQRLRMRLARRSHLEFLKALEVSDFEYFRKGMQLDLMLYDAIRTSGRSLFPQTLKNRIKRILKR